MASPLERVLRRTSKSGDCWLCDLGLRDGYSTVTNGRGRTLQSHRVVYEAICGPIPDGLQADHLCRNRNCVRPDHIDVVSQRDNILRSEAWGGVNARKSHCRRGHKFTQDNTYRRPAHPTWRECRKCRRIYHDGRKDDR